MFIIFARAGLQPLFLLIINFFGRQTLLALVKAKYFSDLMLYIDNQHLFLQHHAAIFIPASGAMQINKIIFHLIIIFNINLLLIFALHFTWKVIYVV